MVMGCYGAQQRHQQSVVSLAIVYAFWTTFAEIPQDSLWNLRKGGPECTEMDISGVSASISHGDTMNWTHFPHYWPFVPGVISKRSIFSKKGQ